MLDLTSIIALLVGSIGAFILFRYWFSGAASGSVPPNDTKKAVAASGVLAQAYKPFPLIERKIINHNTRIYRFGLPKVTDVLDLPIGQHISLRAMTAYSDKVEYRSYTPISDNDDVGYFDLLVKVYEKGVMTRHLDGLKVGDTIDVRGPKGNYTYVAGHHSALLMLAGGTGITPMFQIIKAIAKNPNDTTNVCLVYANVTEEDILLRHELEEYSQDPRISVTFSLDKPTDSWAFERGFITADMIQRANAPAATAANVLALVCGPPLMCKAMENNLTKLGFAEDQRHIF